MQHQEAGQYRIQDSFFACSNCAGHKMVPAAAGHSFWTWHDSSASLSASCGRAELLVLLAASVLDTATVPAA